MSTSNELCFMSATMLAAEIRAGRLSAREVMRAHLDQIERLNQSVNAIVTLDEEGAMRRAFEADEAQANGELIGPLHGLPIAHKDTFLTAGMRTTFGSPLFKDYIPVENSTVVARAQNAGAISLGKTNVPEFAAGSQTFNKVFGPTRNPYNLELTCGGSSGGAAVALACGLVPLADGSDMGGSLRNPANFCNIVGLRPSIGRVPQYPGANRFDVLCASGPMARSVEDAALLLSVISGADPRDPMSFAEESAQYRTGLEHDFTGTRVAWTPDFGCLPVASDVTKTIQQQLNVFKKLGCEIDEASPDLFGAHESFHTLRGMIFETTYGHLYPDQREALKDTVIWNLELGRNLTAPRIAQAERLRSQCFANLSEFLSKYDFLIAPVSQVVPFPLEQEYVTEINGIQMESYIDWMSSCYFVSITGHPAISVPCGFTENGLPVGIQIIGRYRKELELLRFAYMFEQLTRFASIRPQICKA